MTTILNCVGQKTYKDIIILKKFDIKRYYSYKNLFVSFDLLDGTKVFRSKTYEGEFYEHITLPVSTHKYTVIQKIYYPNGNLKFKRSVLGHHFIMGYSYLYAKNGNLRSIFRNSELGQYDIVIEFLKVNKFLNNSKMQKKVFFE